MMNITPFSPAERKALMEELFPLKRTARDYDLRQDMTLDGYIASVIVRAQRQLDSGTLPSASIAAAIRQDRGITFFFIMIFSFVFVLLTPTL